MRYLLSIKTVIPKPGGRVWNGDQVEAHDQIYDGDDGIDYAFMVCVFQMKSATDSIRKLPPIPSEACH